MKKISCLIADDEQLAREVLVNYIQKLHNLNLVATCVNGIEVYTAIKEQPIDLLFLDIQMPHLTGIELLRTLNEPPAVILITAYREFALEGYELNILDYLLKPVSFERFLKALDKYERLMGTIPDRATTNIKQHNDAFIYIKSDKKMVRIMLKDILFIEGLKDYVKLYCITSDYITYQTLAYFEEKLADDRFIRVHRSFIVSLDHVNSYTARQLEIGKRTIPIGEAYAKQTHNRLNL